MVRIRNLTGRSKTRWTQQNVTVRNKHVSGLFCDIYYGHFENPSLAIFSLSIKW